MSRVLFIALLCSMPACQCVQLPTELRCTPESCAAGEVCGDDGRCAPMAVTDGGCVPTKSCALEGLSCGRLSTGCGEVDCGTCTAGETCGVVTRGQCAPCVPDAFDPPDPNFVDANCDGLDGTIDGGLFVSRGGSDQSGTGTQSNPLFSLRRAAELVATRPEVHTVFIGEGTYEGVTWTAPVSLAGGYDPSWSRSSTALTRLRGPGVGLRLVGVPASVSVSQVSIEGTTADGGATVGLELGDSPVLLEGVIVRAGDGAPGAPGLDGSEGARGGDGGVGGQGTSGSPCKADPCVSEPIAGDVGAGGTGVCGDGLPGIAPRNANLDVSLVRQVMDDCTACPCPSLRLPRNERVEGLDAGAAGDSSAGADGAHAPPSATPNFGSLDDAGRWQPTVELASGGAGDAGAPGPGGMAGGSASYETQTTLTPTVVTYALGSSGGGGGAPGCGGRGGGPAMQGGASIGVLLRGASARFQNVSVFSGRGGAGGAAGQGGVGGAGGEGGEGGPRWEAHCLGANLSVFELEPPSGMGFGALSNFFGGAGGHGGRGGAGGAGGAGAPGRGGPSVGVWCVNASLGDAGVNITAGAGGPGASNPAGTAAAGPSQAQLGCD